MSSRKRSWKRALAGAGLGLLLLIGCAQIFGIDEACEVDTPGCTPRAGAGGMPELPGAGAAGMGVPAGSGGAGDAGVDRCPSYCNAIMTNCVGVQLQYIDMDDCLSVCARFPEAPDGSARNRNTLDCRLPLALNPSPSESDDCLAAGPLGNGDCGSICDSYCSLMSRVCPENYARFAPGEAAMADGDACQAHCVTLTDRGGYDSTQDSIDEYETDALGPMTATRQCRIWHLVAAAAVGEPNNTHCEHAIAMSDCIGPPTLVP